MVPIGNRKRTLAIWSLPKERSYDYQIPTEFLDKIEEGVPDTAILRGPSGCSCPVKVRQEDNGVFLVDGWEDFRVRHSLVSAISFLIFRYCGNWCFEVDIFSASGLEKEIVDAGGNNEAGPSGVKSKRGRRDKKSVASLKDHLPKSSGLEKEIVDAGGNNEAGPSGVKSKRGRRDKKSVASLKDHLPKSSGLEKEIVDAGGNNEAGPSGVKSKRGRRDKRSVGPLKGHLPKSSGLEKEIVDAGGNNEAGPSGVKSKRGRREKKSVGSLKDHLPKSFGLEKQTVNAGGNNGVGPSGVKCKRGKRSVGSLKDHLKKSAGLEKEIINAGGNIEACPSGLKSKRGRRDKKSVGSLNDHLPKSRVPSPGELYRSRTTWDLELVSHYLDSCLEEAAKERTASGNLTPESWQKVQSVLKEKTSMDFRLMQLLNKWNTLRRSYIVWSKIIAEAKYGEYDPVTHKINWNQKQWEEYIKVNPRAKEFCKKSLACPEKMKLLFGCYVVAHEDGGDPCEENVMEQH